MNQEIVATPIIRVRQGAKLYGSKHFRGYVALNGRVYRKRRWAETYGGGLDTEMRRKEWQAR